MKLNITFLCGKKRQVGKRVGTKPNLKINTIVTRLLAMVVLFYFLIVGCSCNDDEVELKPTAILATEHIGVTEVWLKVTINKSNGTFDVKRDKNTLVATLKVPIDTIIYDEGLLPKHSYAYTAGLSKALTVTTMDTTSHDFTWQIDTLGDGATSVLYDVAIINDTLAYAVGEVYKRDSMGQWETIPYNAAKWNGKIWQLQRETFYFQGYPYVTQLYSTIMFSENDIWVGTGGPYHWNGSAWTSFNVNGIFNGRVTKFWGTSSSNVYMVGTNGSLAYYDGTAWQKLESGTTLDIFDIYGAFNPKINRYEILAVASDPVGPRYEKKLLKIEGTTVTSLLDSGLSKDATSIWFKPERKYYIVGSGIYQKQNLSDSVWRRYAKGEVTSYSSSSVRGNDINDVFVAGSIFEIVHFNGITWHKYSDLTQFTSGAVSGVIKDNLAIFVGIWNSRAIAIIGKRNGGVSKR